MSQLVFRQLDHVRADCFGEDCGCFCRACLYVAHSRRRLHITTVRGSISDVKLVLSVCIAPFINCSSVISFLDSFSIPKVCESVMCVYLIIVMNKISVL